MLTARFWEIVITSDDGATPYPEYFRLKPKDPPGPLDTDGQAFVNLINSQLQAFVGESAQNGTPEAVEQLREVETVFLKALRDLAERYVAGEPHSDLFREYGLQYGTRIERIKNIMAAAKAAAQLSVRCVDSDGATATDKASDLKIEVGDGALLTVAQRQLIIDVRRALTVVLIVFDRRSRRRGFPAIWSNNTEYAKRVIDGARTQYLSKLAEIAKLGLKSADSTQFAVMQLDAFKDEFVAREADAVKSQHVQALGIRAASIVFGMAVVYFLASQIVGHLPDNRPANLLTPNALRNLSILIAGSAAGTWLSFSLRRVVIGFSDLSLLEEDRLAPFSRLIFVGLLTLVFGLLLVTKLVAINIGQTPVLANNTAAMTLLIGMLCGIAERALAGAVSRKAGDIVGKVEPAVAPTMPSVAAGATK